MRKQRLFTLPAPSPYKVIWEKHSDTFLPLGHIWVSPNLLQVPTLSFDLSFSGPTLLSLPSSSAYTRVRGSAHLQRNWRKPDFRLLMRLKLCLPRIIRHEYRRREGRERESSRKGAVMGSEELKKVKEQQRIEQQQANQEKAAMFMVLLTIQYGVQPLISKRFTGRQVIMTSAVLMCEFVKIIGALGMMVRDGSLWRLRKDWKLSDSLKASALPAGIYAVQNTLLQLSYRHLDSLTFSLLNQTKLVFTAVFMFLLLGNSQSRQQVGALILLMGAALLLSLGKTAPQQRSNGLEAEVTLWMGVIPILAASMLSGLASTLCQWAAQVKRRSTYLMTLEMSTFGSLCLLASMYWSPDGAGIQKRGFFYGWTLLTFVPIVTNAIGGILVGLVTQYAGGVKKGFVIVSALLVTAALELVVDGMAPSGYAVAALPLVVSSTIIHQRYPYKPKAKIG